MYRFPTASTAIPLGFDICAAVAAPPSPPKPSVPSPATVVINCVVTLTFRIRLLPESAIYRFPAESKAMSAGLFSFAKAASPLSPENPAVPDPAATVTFCVVADNSKTCWFPRSTMNRSPDESTATLTGLSNCNVLLPPPPAPPAPPPPPPADVLPPPPIPPLPPPDGTKRVNGTVVMTCVAASTIRIRLFPASAIYRFPAESTATPTG